MHSPFFSRTVPALALATVLVASRAGAAPIASAAYIETDLGGGFFQYDYEVRNEADPVVDAGADLYDVTFLFSPHVTPATWLMPPGWDLIGGAGFINTFSTIPGADPVGGDIGPGQSLAGFRLVLDGRIRDASFQVLFVNPNDPGNPVPYDGVSTEVEPTPVPEPSSLALVTVLLVGSLFRASAAGAPTTRRRR